MRLSYHSGADHEIVQATAYYARQRISLGEEFIEAIDDAVQRIMTAPRQQAVVHGTIRQHLVDRFPYSILYRVNAQRVRILAMRHHSQHPDYGLKRR